MSAGTSLPSVSAKENLALAHRATPQLERKATGGGRLAPAAIPGRQLAGRPTRWCRMQGTLCSRRGVAVDDRRLLAKIELPVPVATG